MAGAIAELAHKTLSEDFRRIDSRSARILLLDGAPRVLPSFSEDLSRSALAQLRRMEVEVHTGAIVKEVGDRGVTVNGEFVPSRTVVWAAGNAAAPIGKSLGANVDRAGRVIVNEDLSIPGHPEIFAIGDMTCLGFHITSLCFAERRKLKCCNVPTVADFPVRRLTQRQASRCRME
jgi:NADH:ubiquinone reductase (H+-translocating)